MNITFESKGNFDELEKWLNKVSTSDPTPALKQIANDGTRSLSSRTPRDTGGTAAGWEGNIVRGKLPEVVWTNTAHSGASVNIAKIIDQGHGTGTGGYVPANPYIVKAMDSIWKNAGDRIFKELIK